MQLRTVVTKLIGVMAAATASLSTVGLMPVALVAAFAAPLPALAQDASLIANLAALTRQKGYGDVPMGRSTCEHLGLTPIGDCRVFEEVYLDPYGFAHSFNILTTADEGAAHIFLVKHSRRHTYYYVAGTDGRLLRAAVFDRKGTFAWSTIPNETAKAAFDQELSYWRLRQNQLAHEPDRRH